MKKIIIIIFASTSCLFAGNTVQQIFGDCEEIILSIVNFEEETNTFHAVKKQNGKYFYTYSIGPLRFEHQLLKRADEYRREIKEEVFNRIREKILDPQFLLKVKSLKNANLSDVHERISIRTSTIELSFPGFGWYIWDEESEKLIEMEEIVEISTALRSLKE